MKPGGEVRIKIISGSDRADSHSARISKFVFRHLEGFESRITPSLLEMNCINLNDWQPDQPKPSLWPKISEELINSDAFVFVVPEWHGMVPPKMKSIFFLAGHAEFAHKPCLIISLSASDNGVHPVVELKSASSKNNSLVYIPNHVIIRRVKEHFINTNGLIDRNSKIENRLNHSLNILLEYANALKHLRKSSIINHHEFIYGM